MTEALLDRQAELDAVAAAARAAVGGIGGTLFVEGPAGIGKTGLLRAGRQIADGLGLLVLTARGAELEHDFGFGVVRQLFEPVPLRRELIEAALTGAARAAAALLELDLPEAAPLPGGPDAAPAMVSALYRLTSNLARRAPLALLVDDVHWADPASVRFLCFLARRLEGLPVLLVVAGRPGGKTVAPLLLDDDVRLLRPRPLGEAAAAQLVRAALPDATDDMCSSCLAASGGNPFFLRELAEALREAGPTRAALDVVPQNVAAAVRARIDRLAPPASGFANALGVLGDGASLRHVAQAAGLADHAAASAADALIAAEILASTRPLRFMHPLIRSAVYEQLPPGERAIAHERAARLLEAEDAPPERVAAHLLVSEPRRQRHVCERLQAAAVEGMRRGAPEAAVTYLLRALEEPPPPETRPELLLELGEAEAMTLNPAPAADHLAQGIDGIRDPQRRLTAALLLAGILAIDDRSLEGVEVLERALAESQDAEPALLARIEAHLVNVARFDLVTRQRSAAAAARILKGVREGLVDGGVELSAAAAEEAMMGDSALRTGELAGRALAALVSEKAPVTDYNAYTATRCLLIADQFDHAGSVLNNAVEQAREHGAVVAEAIALSFRSELHYRVGALQAALADGHASLQTTRAGWRVGLPAMAASLVRVLVERGELAAADVALKEGGLTGPPNSIGTSYPETLLLHARGGLRLAQANPSGALDDLIEVGRRQEILAEQNPALIDWRSLAALALAELDRRDEAVALSEQEVLLARRFGAPRALGLALSAAGAIRGAGAGLGHLREAEAVLAESPARLSHAHALSKLGTALRQCSERDEARATLSHALDIAHTCGATALQSHTLRELRRTGARPRRQTTHGPDALTASERRAAHLAAQGLSNQEIADALFVTVRTVEFHLSGAFKKLGIRSRQELSHQLNLATDPG
ncbi:MAG: helix-turn-helix transcriptional regulator [Solirubrobacteraceae bacterium]